MVQKNNVCQQSIYKCHAFLKLPKHYILLFEKNQGFEIRFYNFIRFVLFYNHIEDNAKVVEEI